MKMLSQNRQHYRIEQKDESVLIEITSRRGVLQILWFALGSVISFYFLAVPGVVWALIFALGLFSDSYSPTTSLLGFALFLFATGIQAFIVYIGYIAAYALSQELTGKELIKVEAGKLTLVLEVLGWIKTKNFAIENVKGLRLLEEWRVFFRSPFAKNRFEKFAFEADGETYRFGYWLNWNETKELLSIIQKALDKNIAETR